MTIANYCCASAPFAAWLVSGCAVQMFLPPTGISALVETPTTVGEGAHAVRGSVGGIGRLLGAAVRSGSITYTRGLSETSEITVGPVVQNYGKGGESIDGFEPSHAFGYGADVRYKARPFGTEHVAVYAGGGGTYNRYAAFVTAQVGASVGYANAYVVPFFDVHAYGAEPLASTDFVFRGDKSAPGKVLHPSRTGGLLASGGLCANLPGGIEVAASVNVGGVLSETDKATVGGFVLGAGYKF